MSLRSGFSWCVRGLLVLATAWLWCAPLAAQAEDEPETEILAHEEGFITVGRQRAPLPWARSTFGPLVALTPVVEVLGGEMETGPLGEAHTLRVAGREVVLGPLGRRIVVDGEIHTLSIRPWIEPEPEIPPELFEDEEEEAEDGEEGRREEEPEDADPLEPELSLEEQLLELPPRELFVPVDALARAWPESQGYRFDFDRRRGELVVTRTGERRLDVEVDRVHDLGATTVVVTFSGRPRYRLEEHRSGVRLRLLSDVMQPQRRVRLNDPLVRWLEVGERTIDIGLAPRAEASEPYLLGRPPRVQLVLDITRNRIRDPLGSTSRAIARRREEAAEFRIVLDPGHGGGDTGVSSPTGETEKDVVLAIARQLRSHLERTVGARVVLTRSDDSEVALEDRTAAANQRRADLFLSLHMSSGSTAGAGFQAYVLDPPPAPFEADGEEGGEEEPDDVTEPPEALEPEGDVLEPEDAALDAEALEDDEIMVAVPALEPWERVQDAQLERSGLLARLIQSHVSDALQQPNRQINRAPLQVLTGATMPAVLIELGSVTHGEEGSPALDAVGRQAMVEAIGRAIRLYRAAIFGPEEPEAESDGALDGDGTAL